MIGLFAFFLLIRVFCVCLSLSVCVCVHIPPLSMHVCACVCTCVFSLLIHLGNAVNLSQTLSKPFICPWSLLFCITPFLSLKCKLIIFLFLGKLGLLEDSNRRKTGGCTKGRDFWKEWKSQSSRWKTPLRRVGNCQPQTLGVS